jgi:glutaryl-CoA dehydrogenase
MDHIAYGLIMQELERGDTGIRSMASVQTSLVMFPIYAYGTEEQRKKYLPRLASGEIIGCFGLTEPNYGSDPGSMITRMKDMGDHYLLNGAKMWITNSTIADVSIVWAKDENNVIRGLIVEKGLEGLTAPETHGKWSLRASVTGELVFDNVKVPKDCLLPNVKGLKGPLSCLSSARYGIAWGAIGAAMDCFDAAVRYSKERIQFGKPIAAMQLQQKKLAEALTEITKAQLLTWRCGVLKNEGKVTPAQISMAKRNNVEMALNIAREMRQVLGAMGITNDYPMMRHMMNLESVITYEGTHDVHLLITGEAITGLPAYK